MKKVPIVIVILTLDNFSGPDPKKLGSPAGGNVACKEERSPQTLGNRKLVGSSR